jgi:transcriptional regulator with GAF, ATPase, and Fis domain
MSKTPLCEILEEAKGRVGGANGAAARLGLKRTTLIYRMKKLGIDARRVLDANRYGNVGTSEHFM